jgi:hypothetical protein
MSHPSCSAKSFYVAGVKVRSAALERNGQRLTVVGGQPSGPGEISVHQLIEEGWAGDLTVNGKALPFDPAAAQGRAGRAALTTTLAINPLAVLDVDPATLPQDEAGLIAIADYSTVLIDGLRGVFNDSHGLDEYARAISNLGSIEPSLAISLARSATQELAENYEQYYDDVEQFGYDPSSYGDVLRALTTITDASTWRAWQDEDRRIARERLDRTGDYDQYQRTLKRIEDSEGDHWESLQSAQMTRRQEIERANVIERQQAATAFLSAAALTVDTSPDVYTTLAAASRGPVGALADGMVATLTTSELINVVTALSHGGSTGAARALVDTAATNPDPEKRRAGLDALSEVYRDAGDAHRRIDPFTNPDFAATACPIVLRAMSDSDPQVRSSAAIAAYEMAHFAGQTPLMLTTALIDPGSQQTALDTLDRLARSGSPQATPIIADVTRGLADFAGPDRAEEFSELHRRAVRGGAAATQEALDIMNADPELARIAAAIDATLAANSGHEEASRPLTEVEAAQAHTYTKARDEMYQSIALATRLRELVNRS